jgi:tRNA 5-methylaminomethyl-2-thiouridine biosynthesis bifunctional protein
MKQRIAVIGLGLAGACMVRALAQWAGPDTEVAAYEAAAAPATGASGNPLGVMHPLVSKDWNLASQFYAAGIQETWAWCEALGGLKSGWAGRCGAVLMRQGGVEPGLEPTVETSGGWIQPQALVAVCLEEARARLGGRLTIHLNARLGPAQLTEIQESSAAVVVCAAGDMLVPWATGLCLNRIAGQLSWLPAQPHEGPSQVVCGDGYVAPVVQGRLVVGASFERLGEGVAAGRQGLRTQVLGTQASQPEFTSHDDAAMLGSPWPVTAQGHASNRLRLEALLPDLAAALADRWPQAQGRASVRVATRDRLPHAGQLWDAAAQLPRSVSRLEQMPRQAGLYALLGLGSRGLSIAPMAATALARWILKDGPPQGRLWQAVDPARFVLRAHQRQIGPRSPV